eukprot:TRINITY_DN10763_c0_g1_i1.p1 TRINITY_DN10763_c0_g1~~TRINITY_DN10763_c0_g1_i1.p1  ORF type:complete len:407 (-),score=50.23 TRINITY_DN10763_c0_g1_i1:69-1289(-)
MSRSWKIFLLVGLLLLFSLYTILIFFTCHPAFLTHQDQRPSTQSTLPKEEIVPQQPEAPSPQYVIVPPTKCPEKVIQVKHSVIGGIHDLVETLHLVFITDGGRDNDRELKNFKVALRSWLYVRKLPMHLHVMTTFAFFELVKETVINGWNINPNNFRIHYYNIDVCRGLLKEFKNYVMMEYPWPSMCKLVVHKMLPETVPFALVQDLDVWVAQPGVVEECWKKVFVNMSYSSDTEYFIGMALDPSPESFTRAKAAWPIKGFFQFNAGILWLYLDKMRRNNFWNRMMTSVHGTYFNKMKEIKARKGEQCFLNAWHVDDPTYLHTVPCGCNYQIAEGANHYRDVVCPPTESIYLVHNWNGNLKVNLSVYDLVSFYDGMDRDNTIIKRLNSYNCPPPLVNSKGETIQCP